MENPFQIVGTYDGDTYIEREADRRLQRSIADNQSYPYFCAPRQSGKSSLIVHTINVLPKDEYECLLIDLSEILGDYTKFENADNLLSAVLVYIAVRLNLNEADISCDFPEDTFMNWLSTRPTRLIVFLDELDALIEANRFISEGFSADFLQRLRGLFNKRSEKNYRESLRKIQFVLAGAAHPLHLAPDKARSPFNVGTEIPLLDLSIEQVRILTGNLQKGGILPSKGAIKFIYEQTCGIVHLTRLILREIWEQLFNTSMPSANRKILTKSNVSSIIKKIILESTNNIHFLDIYRRVSNNPCIKEFLTLHWKGRLRNNDNLTELMLTGISSRQLSFRCCIYARVFGPGGPLELVAKEAVLFAISVPNIIFGRLVVGFSVAASAVLGIYLLRNPIQPPRTFDMASRPDAWPQSQLTPDMLMVDAAAPGVDLGNVPIDAGEAFDGSAISTHPRIKPRTFVCTKVFPACISRSEALEPRQRKLIVTAIHASRVRLCGTETILLIRQGNRLVLGDYPSRLASDVETIELSLIGAFASYPEDVGELPGQVRIQCKEN